MTNTDHVRKQPSWRAGATVALLIGAVLLAAWLYVGGPKGGDPERPRSAVTGTDKLPQPPSALPDLGQAPLSMKVGTTLILDSMGSKVEVTVTRVASRTTPCGSDGVKPTQGRYVMVAVVIDIIEGTGAVNPLFFTWVNPDGTSADALSGWSAGCPKMLGSQNGLAVGSRRAGTVIFDTSSDIGTIEYGVTSVLGRWLVS